MISPPNHLRPRFVEDKVYNSPCLAPNPIRLTLKKQQQNNNNNKLTQPAHQVQPARNLAKNVIFGHVKSLRCD